MNKEPSDWDDRDDEVTSRPVNFTPWLDTTPLPRLDQPGRWLQTVTSEDPHTTRKTVLVPGQEPRVVAHHSDSLAFPGLSQEYRQESTMLTWATEWDPVLNKPIEQTHTFMIKLVDLYIEEKLI